MRGDGRQYSVMLISRAAPAGPPHTVMFSRARGVDPGEDSAEGLPDADAGNHIAGLAFCGGGAGGRFGFEIHELEMR